MREFDFDGGLRSFDLLPQLTGYFIQGAFTLAFQLDQDGEANPIPKGMVAMLGVEVDTSDPDPLKHYIYPGMSTGQVRALKITGRFHNQGSCSGLPVLLKSQHRIHS
ncbi:MAG: hypothetical protein M3Y27_22175 [Acidobacteriota bacterium]|nr:hypothetical protein [Acidobacteriota bacterium]